MSVADQSPTAPYDALEAVIRRELAAVGARDLDALPALKRERGAIVKRLGLVPPREARPVLERCLELEHQIAHELGEARAAMLSDLEQLRRARRTADGYAPVRVAAPQISASA